MLSNFIYQIDTNWTIISFYIIILTLCLFILNTSNPMHVLLYFVLIYTFLGLFLIFLNCEFIGLTLIIVYAGAILILFLCVIQVLHLKENMNISENIDLFYKNKFAKYGLIVLINFFTIFIFFKVFNTFVAPENWINHNFWENSSNLLITELNNESIITTNPLKYFKELYTSFRYFLYLLGLFLLVTMVGSISISINHKN